MYQSGAQGVCKTHYIISEDAKAERIYLRKTKDLNHCQERIIKDIGLAYTEKCSECEAVSTIYSKITILTFNLWQCCRDDIKFLVNAER